MNENDPTAEPPLDEVAGTSDFEERSLWDKLRLWLLRAAALAGAFVLLLALLTAVSAMYTSRPEFCRSCHNMEPYFESWQSSSHSNVSCVKCHFPPGVGEKVRGKLLGLVQLAKYVTSSEGPRPAAEVPDSSCLRSGCHETRVLAGRVEFHGVPFDHRPHMGEMRRGKRLRCTSCHSQIVQGTHMTVTTSTCFLCHFKDGHLNEGLGACTRCHQIPDKEFDLGGGAIFDHDVVYERGVDCGNCHADLIRGNGEVPRERCSVCHNRTDDLKRIDDHEFLHRKHVTEHKVDCLECHLRIQHSLDEHRVRNAASDCQSCHPEHHQEQVNMLQGIGGKSIPDRTTGMAVARISCPSCHKVKEISPTGTILWKASAQVCTMCHEASAAERLQAYHKQLEDVISEIESSMGRARTALDSAELDADRLAANRARLDRFQDDLDFLRVADCVHNVHYASALTDAILDGLSKLCRDLEIAEPKVTLPETMEGFK